MIIKSEGKRGKRSICTCLNCGEEFSELDIKIRDGGGKFCTNSCYKEYRKKNAKDPKERNVINQKKYWYNLTEEEYKNLFITQNNKCAICGKEFTKTDRGVVDHNHMTKKVRGALCMKCNFLLGLANDDINILKNAITYLEKS